MGSNEKGKGHVGDMVKAWSVYFWPQIRREIPQNAAIYVSQ